MSFKDSIGAALGNVGLTLSKHSPTIAVGAGVIGLVGTVVLASRATLNAQYTLGIHEANMNTVTRNFEEFRDGKSKIPYMESELRRDKTGIWIRTMADLGKLYAPSIILGGLSVAAILAGHNQMSQRLVGMTAAYEGLAHTFKKYRGVVTEELGAEKEENLYQRASLQTMEVDDDGNSIFRGSATQVWFDEDTSANYEPSDWKNSRFLHDVQAAMNRQLQYKGHVFLNDVFDALGLPETPAGCQLGWLRGGPNENTKFIDFGLDLNTDKVTRARINETVGKNAVLLDFNIDGVIWNLL